jgi:hypothetical protein
LAHELLAHHFAGEETLALVGDLVLAVERGLFAAPRAARFIQRFIARFCSRWMPGVSTSSNWPSGKVAMPSNW